MNTFLCLESVVYVFLRILKIVFFSPMRFKKWIPDSRPYFFKSPSFYLYIYVLLGCQKVNVVFNRFYYITFARKLFSLKYHLWKINKLFKIRKYREDYGIFKNTTEDCGTFDSRNKAAAHVHVQNHENIYNLKINYKKFLRVQRLWTILFSEILSLCSQKQNGAMKNNINLLTTYYFPIFYTCFLGSLAYSIRDVAFLTANGFLIVIILHIIVIF